MIELSQAPVTDPVRARKPSETASAPTISVSRGGGVVSALRAGYVSAPEAERSGEVAEWLKAQVC